MTKTIGAQRTVNISAIRSEQVVYNTDPSEFGPAPNVRGNDRVHLKYSLLSELLPTRSLLRISQLPESIENSITGFRSLSVGDYTLGLDEEVGSLPFEFGRGSVVILSFFRIEC